MSEKGQGLAARLRASITDKVAAAHAARANADDAAAAAKAARESFFDDLVAFAHATGFIIATRFGAGPAGDEPPSGVRFRWGDRELQFERDGDADGVLVSYAAQRKGSTHALYREPLLGYRWVWRYQRGPREHRVAFFDQGLELLLVDALGLPSPEEDAPAAAPLVSTAPSPPGGRKRTL